MSETSSYVTIYCPMCGDPAEDMPPDAWCWSEDVPGYRHATDRTALCPTVIVEGERPAEPVEGLLLTLERPVASTLRRRPRQGDLGSRTERTADGLACGLGNTGHSPVIAV